MMIRDKIGICKCNDILYEILILFFTLLNLVVSFGGME